MPVSGVAAPAVTPQPPLQPSATTGHRKHEGHNPSMSDIGGQSSSLGPPSNSTGRIGSVLDIRI
jgi:hypothetical protein